MVQILCIKKSLIKVGIKLFRVFLLNKTSEKGEEKTRLMINCLKSLSNVYFVYYLSVFNEITCTKVLNNYYIYYSNNNNLLCWKITFIV